MNGLYQVYVLRNENGQFYIGLSEHVRTRLQEHNSGVSKWTRNRGPWILIWISEPMSLSDARRLEIRLKKQKGGAGFYAMTGLVKMSAHNPVKWDRGFKSCRAHRYFK
jgi:putative endonuclease